MIPDQKWRPRNASARNPANITAVIDARNVPSSTTPFPQESLFSGAHFLKQLLTRFGGNAALALGAYNAGAGRVEEAGGVPEIPETTRYVQQILAKLPLP